MWSLCIHNHETKKNESDNALPSKLAAMFRGETKAILSFRTCKTLFRDRIFQYSVETNLRFTSTKINICRWERNSQRAFLSAHGLWKLGFPTRKISAPALADSVTCRNNIIDQSRRIIAFARNQISEHTK